MSNNNPTIFSPNFLAKYTQFQKLTTKIDNLIQFSKQQIHDKIPIIKNKLILLKTQLNLLKQQFYHLKNTSTLFQILPKQFSNIFVHIILTCEDYWKSREDELLKNLQIKSIQCKILRDKFISQQQQISPSHTSREQLKLKYQQIKDRFLLNQSYQHISNQQQIQTQKIQDKFQKAYKQPNFDIIKMEISLNEIQTQSQKDKEQQNYTDLQDFYQNINQPLFPNQCQINLVKPIDQCTQHQQETQEHQKQPQQLFQLNKKRKKASIKQTDKQKFWQKFIKYISTKKKQLKNKQRTSLKNIKQNIINHKQISLPQKKYISSKINDLRKILFDQKYRHQF